MTLKFKISLVVSLLFTLIFAISGTVVYTLFADFRQEEFESRLNDKAVSSIKLLVEVEEIDQQLLKIIDQNSINKLYNEKTLIFDSNYKLIYSSLDDAKIKWTENDLKYLKKHKTFFKKENEQEIYGVFYDTHYKDFYALVAATDTSGKRKLEYLFYVLIITYTIFTCICWFTTSFLVKKLLMPLDVFHNKIKGINENNLNTRIPVKDQKDEIDLLAFEFNQMIERIAFSYQSQKEFTANASHELRTPIARVTAQLENEIIANKKQIISSEFHEKLLTDINQISELITSLLILSKAENNNSSQHELCRVDELFFDATEKINKLYPDFKLIIEIEEIEEIEFKANKSLLLIAITNLLKNAYYYSNDKTANVQIKSGNKCIIVSISNNGQTLSEIEKINLFQAFMRGENAKNKSGLGLGLKIVQRILIEQKASISYHSDFNNTFVLNFPL